MTSSFSRVASITLILFALAVCTLLAAKPAESRPQRDFAPISKLIDQEIQKKRDAAKIKPSPLCSDAEFVRRVSLDITGRIPAAEKAAQFIDSKDPDKRRKLIDELLVSPLYGSYFGNNWRNLVFKGDDNNMGLDTTL